MKWSRAELEGKEKILVAADCISFKEDTTEENLVNRYWNVVFELQRIFDDIYYFMDDGLTFIVERQSVFNTPKGLGAAMSQRIVYPIFFSTIPIVIYQNLTVDLDPDSVRFVTPIVWRGQVPERILRDRIESNLGSKLPTKNPHAIDAIGLALYGIKICTTHEN